MSLEISFLRSKLARRLFVLFISCALVPTVVLALLSFVHVSHQLSEQSKRRLHRTSKITGLAIHERLVILEIILKSLEGNIAEAPAQPLGGTSRILKERLEERFSAVTVVTAGGTQRAVTRGIESFPELTPPQRRHLAAGKTLLLTLRAADSRPQMVMIRKTSRALAEERHLVGVVRGSYLWNVAAASSFSGGTEFCVLGEANEPLACSLQAPIILPDDVLAAMHRSSSGHFEWQHDGKPYVAYYWSAFLKGAFGMPKLTFVLAEARADVMAPMAAFRSSFPLVVMLAIWVVLLLSTRQIRRSLVPLAELMRGTREIARQRFNTRVEVTSGDEFQDLADSFNSMAERLNKQFRLSVIGEIISGVAHELNNAVTGVVGFSQLVLSRNGDAHIARDLKNVNDSALRCQSIVKNLLDFSRGRKPERMYLHIDGILEKTLELKEHQLSVNGIEVVRNLDPKLPGTMIDFYQMQQVLLNLINNAQYAIKQARVVPGQLIVRSSHSNGRIMLEIIDNGTGMDEATLHRIFDPFFTTKGDSEGTGLGLSVSYGIVKEHGGRLTARSEKGKGSTFAIELPIVKRIAGTQAVEAEPSLIAAETPASGWRILVVDDEPVLLNLLDEILRGHGYAADTAVNGNKAFDKVREADYDLVVTDIRMPEMNGMDLYRNILAVRPAMGSKILFITGDLFEKDTTRFLDEVGAPFLPKPLDIPRLLATVREMLQGPALQTREYSATENPNAP